MMRFKGVKYFKVGDFCGVEQIWAQNIIFFCQLPFCPVTIVATQVTQELACVLSACKLVCIVYVRMYSCPLHRTILSSTLFFLETLFCPFKSFSCLL